MALGCRPGSYVAKEIGLLKNPYMKIMVDKSLRITK